MDNNKENFDNTVKDGCHYICSSLNWLNIFLTIVLIVLIYLYFVPTSQ
jgi:hypothetical protein